MLLRGKSAGVTEVRDEALALIAWRLTVGVQALDDLVPVAADALARGLESRSLRALADAQSSADDRLAERFWDACDELGIERPSLSMPVTPDRPRSGSLSFRLDAVRVLLEADEDAAALGLVTIAEFAAGWCRYTRWYHQWTVDHTGSRGGPVDEEFDAQPDSWAATLVWAIPSPEYRRAMLVELVETATEDVLPSVAARFFEDYIWDDEECLRWVEQQCASSPRFRRTLAHAWLWTGMSPASFARLEAAAGVQLAKPNRTNDPTID